MIGSEKQIKWAEDIIARIVAAAEKTKIDITALSRQRNSPETVAALRARHPQTTDNINNIIAIDKKIGFIIPLQNDTPQSPRCAPSAN